MFTSFMYNQINLYPNQLVEEDTPALFQAAFKFSILKVIIVLSFT